MSYSDSVMQSLAYRIRDLNNNINVLKELKEEMKRANNLKELELGLQTGAYSTEEAKKVIESMKLEPPKTKGFWKNR